MQEKREVCLGKRRISANGEKEREKGGSEKKEERKVSRLSGG